MSSWDINYESQAVLWLPAMDTLVHIQHSRQGQESLLWTGRITASHCVLSVLFSRGPESAFAVACGPKQGPFRFTRGLCCLSRSAHSALDAHMLPLAVMTDGWDVKEMKKRREHWQYRSNGEKTQSVRRGLTLIEPGQRRNDSRTVFIGQSVFTSFLPVSFSFFRTAHFRNYQIFLLQYNVRDKSSLHAATPLIHCRNKCAS